MENKDLTQLIESSAQELSENYPDHRAYEIHEGFMKGAQYGLSLQKDMMIGFAEWIDTNGWVKTDVGHWSDENDNRILTTAELVTLYLSHLNQPAGK